MSSLKEWIDMKIEDGNITSFEYNGFSNIVKINQGGFGIVNRADWNNGGIMVALKSLLNDSTIEEDQKTNFLKELKLLRQVNTHPNINQFLGITKDEHDNYIIVLQYANQGNLREYLQKNFPSLQWKDKIRMALDITCGLKYLHFKQIIHRDLHAKNILVNNGILMITDLGLSKQLGEINSNSKLFGMFAYIEPQCYIKHKYKQNEKSDIYSLGVLFWEISSGKPPFSEIPPFKINLNIINGIRETPIENTPFKYQQLYENSWKEEPNQRPNLDEVYEVLNQLKLQFDNNEQIEDKVTQDSNINNSNSLTENFDSNLENLNLFSNERIKDKVTDINNSNSLTENFDSNLENLNLFSNEQIEDKVTNINNSNSLTENFDSNLENLNLLSNSQNASSTISKERNLNHNQIENDDDAIDLKSAKNEDENSNEVLSKSSEKIEYEEIEREAIADLLTYLENRAETNFFEGDPLRTLSTLAFSDNVDIQRSAALAFAEITEKEDVREVDRETMEPIMFLLQSHDVEVQRAASEALGNLAVNTENKLLIVQMGGLEPLIRQMLSPNVEVQCNAVGCITDLSIHDENKSKIARSGALVPLTRLARSKDIRVHRNAMGALLNMTHSDENRQQLVNAGAIPVLVSLLNSPDTDVQYYCTTALSNIAVDALNRKKIASTETCLVQSLIGLMDSTSLKVQCQAALALRNLASDERYQLEIVRSHGLPSLLRLLQSSFLPLILSSVACIRNISIHPLNESPIIDAGFLSPLIQLLAYEENEEIQYHAISTLRNLAASSKRNKRVIVDAGAVERVQELVLKVPLNIQSEMTACVAVLALSDELKPRLLKLGICQVLLLLTDSTSIYVQGNSAAALGNLSSKVQDYSPFVNVWEQPAGGLNGYLQRFLGSEDKTFQHIAVWTIVQFLEGRDPNLFANISSSRKIVTAIDRLASYGEEPSDDDDDSDEGEIVALARKALDYITDTNGANSCNLTTSPNVNKVQKTKGCVVN